jgi:hypothetical protein
MGNPGPMDTHPLHGELPNARYQQAALVAGTDADGPFMALTFVFGAALPVQPKTHLSVLINKNEPN